MSNTANDIVKEYLGDNAKALDQARGTFLTAGVIVAASLSLPELHQVLIFGKSGIKVVLVSAICSAIAMILSFVFVEFFFRRMDAFLADNTKFRWYEKFFYKNDNRTRLKFFLNFHKDIILRCVKYSNHLSTILLIFALGCFVYILIS